MGFPVWGVASKPFNIKCFGISDAKHTTTAFWSSGETIF